jgi:APA family basic amino acid/polyamine antiporter
MNETAIYEALANIGYSSMGTLVVLGVLAGYTSVILVMLLGQSRVFFSMSRDGLLPRLFSDVHPRFRTPWRCNLLLMILVSLFSGFLPLSILGEMTSIGTLLAFAIVCGGVIIMRRTNPHTPRPYRTPFVPLVPILGIVVCLALMLSLGLGNWLRLLGWLALGLIIYFGYSRHHSKLVTDPESNY